MQSKITKDVLCSLIDKKEVSLSAFCEAFQHTSYVNEQKRKYLKSNERLEFLGDAVLELAVSQFLYREFPDYPEGKLTRLRAQLVCERSLAYLARELRFNEFIQLGKGELANNGNERDSILADCFEAFLGVIYLQYGVEEVQRFLSPLMFERCEELLSYVSHDYKTELQEVLQQNGSIQIEYRVLKQEGPAHQQQFTIGLYVNDDLRATGVGNSKKQAERIAAKKALEQL